MSTLHRLVVNRHISLKHIEMADAPAIFETISNERLYLRTWLPFVDTTQALSDTEAFTWSVVSQPEAHREPVFVIHVDQQFAGLIGLKGTDTVNRKTEIGYWLSQRYQKRGIMTSCVESLIAFSFEQLGINRVQIKCGVGNIPSKKIPKRLGFILEGVERDGELLADGQFTDLETYSLLKREFRSPFR